MSDWYVSSAAWTAIAQFATGTFTVGQIVRPLTAPAFSAQHAFRCTTAGTASAEPTWTSASSNNSTVTAAGGAVFTNVTGQSTYGWSAAAGALYSIGNNATGGGRPAGGDRVFLSSDHSETNTSGSITYSLGTATGFTLVRVISVNRAGSVPPVAADELAGAAITNTGGSDIQINPQTDILYEGVKFTVGGTGGNINFSGQQKKVYIRNGGLAITNTSASAIIQCGSCCQVVLDNTTVQFGNAGQGFYSPNQSMDLTWINTPSAISGTMPTLLFTPSGSVSSIATLRGVDLSAFTNTIYNATNSAWWKILLDSCRIASSVTRRGNTYNGTPDEVELLNCFDGTNIISERHTAAGDVTTDRSTTMVGGAQDDVGLFALKLVSNTQSDSFSFSLDTFWMDVELSTIGSARTATVELISSASLNNTDISLMLEYQGTAGSSLGSFVNSLPSALTTSAALPTSTATWNNPPSTPVVQHIQVSFTPQTAGRVRGLVRLGKASSTVWINPQLVIT